MKELEFKHVRHIHLDVPDRHKFMKELNLVIRELKQFETGDCPHRPDETLTLKNSKENKADGAPCIWCGELLEIKKIVWGLKDTLPTHPRSA